jgi:hypothetical protein
LSEETTPTGRIDKPDAALLVPYLPTIPELPEIPDDPPGMIMVCFQIVTAGGAVVDTEPEPWASIEEATKRAKEWAELRGKTIDFTTFEGDGAVIKTESIEHIAVLRAKKMQDTYREVIAAMIKEIQANE